MPKEDVATNYNNVGTSIMEQIYATDYLSPGGPEVSTMLAELGAVAAPGQVLDIGSGLGGAAFFLAREKGCAVTGIDLMQVNVVQAQQRAAIKAPQQQIRFVTANATAVPFASDQFDLVWGQDAWCHVNDKPELLNEIDRVLKPGGQVVFSDWLLRDSIGSGNHEIRRITASPQMADQKTYARLLAERKFHITHFVDRSTDFTRGYRAVIEQLHNLKASIVDRFGLEVFDKVLGKQELVLAAFEVGELIPGAFVARRSG